jgi:uncharacterized membrane protein
MLKEGHRKDPTYFYVLGSVEVGTALSYLGRSLGGVWVSLRDEIIPEVQPFVAPGKVLISLIAPRPLLTRMGGPEAWDMAINERRVVARRLMTAHSLYMSHIVLGVE